MSPSIPPVSTPAQDPDLSGRQFGDYLVLRRLGRGGMADVYLAEQKSLHRQVAFKALHARLASDQSYIRRFHNEAHAVAALVHANIVQIHGVDCIDGVHFLVQEYVPGQNLQRLLAIRGTLSIAIVVNLMVSERGEAVARPVQIGVRIGGRRLAP